MKQAKRRLRVYVAGPISTLDQNVDTPAYNQIADNVRHGIQVGHALLTAGYAPYVPHLSHYWNLITPAPYNEWLSMDEAWLAVCDVLLRLPGVSRGADHEVELAKELGIPVVHGIAELEHLTAKKRGKRG